MGAKLGFITPHGPDISEGEVAEEHKYSEVVLFHRLRAAVRRAIIV